MSDNDYTAKGSDKIYRINNTDVVVNEYMTEKNKYLYYSWDRVGRNFLLNEDNIRDAFTKYEKKFQKKYTWKTAYPELLLKIIEDNNNNSLPLQLSFELYDLDADSIPELFIKYHGYASMLKVFTMYEEKPVEMHLFSGSSTLKNVSDKNLMVLTKNILNGKTTDFIRKDGRDLSVQAHLFQNESESMFGIDYIEVDENEYRQKYDELIPADAKMDSLGEKYPLNEDAFYYFLLYDAYFKE